MYSEMRWLEAGSKKRYFSLQYKTGRMVQNSQNTLRLYTLNSEGSKARSTVWNEVDCIPDSM
jgi:hypothetical protein